MNKIKTIFAVFGLLAGFALSASAQTVTFTSLDGGKVDLASDKGKVIVLAIGASWLPLSKNQAVAVNKLSKKYTGRDVVFYFIATDSTAAKSKNYASDDEIRKFAQTNKLTVSILRDSDGLLSIKQYKIDQMPAFIIIGRDGKVAGAPFGGIDPDTDISTLLSKRIDGIL
ncbi:MAG: TlpA family protein disulfide reductase [Acidobacteria bacterium]|nr:TlpA family protein disulfide reductase [Acidobacteriota bacterium]